MPSAPECRLILIDKQSVARRPAVLREAVKELRGSGVAVSADICALPPSRMSEVANVLEVANGDRRSVVLVVAVERELSQLTEGTRLPRIPCESIECGFHLIDRYATANDIYFVVNDITGVDVLSLLLSGARGVIDVDALGSVMALKTLIEEIRRLDNRLARRVLVGRPYHTFDSLVERARNLLQMSNIHWALLLALGEIPMMRLASGDKPKQREIADRVGEWSAKTGHFVSNNDMVGHHFAHLLPLLQVSSDDEEFYDERPDTGGRFLTSEEMQDLPYLPEYARKFGAPSRLLPIRDLDQTQLVDRLYKGLNRIQVVAHYQCDGLTAAKLSVPKTLW